MSICPNCKKEFAPTNVIQKYCCKKCGDEYRKNHDINVEWPSITFTCAKCGRVIVTEPGPKDMRTRFCSHECEKKYWKHPHYERKSNRTNFASISQYEAYEKYTNQ